MPRRRVVVGAAWSCAVAMLVGLAVVTQVAWPQDVRASEERCPMLLQREGDVPAWLWALAIEPGTRLVDALDDVDVLSSQATVDDVLVVPSATPPGVQAWVYDFGFLPPEPGEEVFTYAPVLCLGGQVPEVEGLDADAARTLVTGSGLQAVVEGDPAGRVATVVPAVGTVLEFGSVVTVSMAPTRDAPATEPSDPASTTDGGTSGEGTDAGAADSQAEAQAPDGDEAPGGTDPGTSTGARTELGRLLADWGWLAVVAAVGVGLTWATARALRRGRERRWLRQHLRTRAEPGTGDVSVHEDPRLPRHSVRLSPASGPVDTDLEERGGR